MPVLVATFGSVVIVVAVIAGTFVPAFAAGGGGFGGARILFLALDCLSNLEILCSMTTSAGIIAIDSPL